MTSAVPSLVVVTDRRVAAQAGRDLPSSIEAALAGGAHAVLLRDKDLGRGERRRLGETLRRATAAAGALLFVASDGELAADLGADGLHLAASDPPATSGVGLVGPVGLVGRSCHDDAEVVRAREEAADYVFVSPVAASSSKPGHGPALDDAGLVTLVRAAGPVRVLALGGVTPANVPAWRRAGAHGVAVVGGVLAAEDPAAATAALLDAWQAAPTATSS